MWEVGSVVPAFYNAYTAVQDMVGVVCVWNNQEIFDSDLLHVGPEVYLPGDFVKIMLKINRIMYCETMKVLCAASILPIPQIQRIK
jgi:hypothetical protein